jgi:hypothetical protein
MRTSPTDALATLADRTRIRIERTFTAVGIADLIDTIDGTLRLQSPANQEETVRSVVVREPA